MRGADAPPGSRADLTRALADLKVAQSAFDRTRRCTWTSWSQTQVFDRPRPT